MKLGALIGFSLLPSCSALSSPGTQDAPPTGDQRISIYLGQRSLDEDDFEPLEDQAMLAFEFSSEGAGSPLGWEIGLSGSSDEDEILGVDVEASMGELYGGVRKSFGAGKVRPVLGAGLSFVNAEVEASGFGSEDDSSLAGYVHGGVLFALGSVFSLGLDARALLGSDLEIAGVEGDADYVQLALVLGFSL